STDGSVDIIRKYESKLAYWVSENDNGQAHAINKGLQRATGDIVAWLNSDDQYFPDTLQFVSDYFNQNPEVDLIYGDVQQLYSDGRTQYYSVMEFEPLDFLSRVSVHQPSVFWRRKVLGDVGLLDESLYYLMDFDLWIRFFFNFQTRKVNRMLSIFRVHQAAKTYNDPSGLYYDYRKVLSRFFYSIEDTSAIEIIRNLDLYDNPENKKYSLPKESIKESLQGRALTQYIRNCVIQEYSFGHVRETNRLIFHKRNPLTIWSQLFLLLKNNLGVRYLFYKR
ncbi:MAG: glycosyltransferase, partial [Bacteroidetes bacterium]|nr:glycosyltransferase [Bacteroidota bacterium]